MPLSKDELSELLEIAKHAAKLAGAIHREAIGTLSGFYECGLGPLDIAAAAAIAEAAGATVSLLHLPSLSQSFFGSCKP